MESLRGQEGRSSASSTAIVGAGRRSWPPTPRRCRSPRSRPPTRTPAGVVGVHFFNPAPVQNLVEIVRTVVTEPSVLDDVHGARASGSARSPSSAATRPASSPTPCCSATSTTRSSMYEGHYASREDIDAAMRFGCGYPMGPLALLDLIGLDTAYEILDTMYKQGRDRLHAPAPLLKQMRHRRPARPQDRPRLLHLRGPRQPGRGRRRRTPRAPTTSRSCATTSGRSAWSAPARWPPASSRSSPRPGTTCCTSAARPGQGRRRRRHHRALAGQGDPARQGYRGAAKAEVLGRLTRHDLARRPAPTSTSSSRRSPRTCAVKTTLFENLDEICKPGAILATTTSRLPVIEMRAATKRPQDVIGMHFFNPAPIMKLVEVVSTVTTADDGHRDHPGPVRGGRQGRRSPAATAPASSSTRCCSPTSTTR